MDKGITSEQIAGWADTKDGKVENEVEVLVFSQGIQAESLEHDEAMAALGEITVEYVEALFADENVEEAVINDWGKN